MAKTVNAGSVFVKLSLKDKTVKSLKRSQARLNAFASSVNDIGKRMLVAGTLMFAPFVAGSKAFADFEKQMANVSTMLSAPEKHMERFGKGISDMSVKFGESTNTLSKGLYDILSASIPAEKALNVLAVSAKAAKAGLTDTGTAADAITTILNAYKLSAAKAADVSDWLFSIVRKEKTTFMELAPSIGAVATTVASAGIGLNEFGAALSTMTRNGVKTEAAITALQAIISAFLSPSKDAAQYARQLGFEMSSATLKSEGLAGVFQKIAALPPDAVSRLFPNIRALRGALPALQNMKGFIADIKAMKNREGASGEAYAKMAKTISNSLARLKQAGIGIFVALGEALAKPLSRLSKIMISCAKSVKEFIEKNKQLVFSAVKIAAVTLVAGAGLLVLGKMAAIAAGLLGAFAAVLGFVLSPVALLTVAVAGLAVGALYASGVFEGISKIFGSAWKAIGAALASGDLTGAFKVAAGAMDMVWTQLCFNLMDAWDSFVTGSLSLIASSATPIRRLWTALAGYFVGAWIGVKTWFEGFWEYLKTSFKINMAYIEKTLGRISNESYQFTVKVLEDRYKQNTGAIKLQGDKEAADHNAEVKRRISLSDEDYMGEIIKDSDKRMAPYKKALQEAKKEYEEALQEVKSAGKTQDKKIGKTSTEAIEGKLKNAAGAVASARGKVEVAGSFYAHSARALSAGNAADRTAKATEDIKKNTKKTNQILESKTGLAFS